MDADITFIHDRVKHFRVDEVALRKCIKVVADKTKKSQEKVATTLREGLIEIETKCLASKDITLKDYQIGVAKHLFTHRGVVISFQVGVGKTLTAVSSALCLSRHAKFLGKKIKIYVVTPTSLVENFKKEMVKFGVDPKNSNFEFFTITGFVNAYKAGKIQCKDALLIIDEAHNLRKDYRMAFAEVSFGAPDEESTRAYSFIQCAASAWKVILLTATPAYNKPHDIVNLVGMVKGEDPPVDAANFYQYLADEEAFKKYFGCVFAFQEGNPDDYPARIDEYVYVSMTPEYHAKYVALERKIERGMSKNKSGDEESTKNSFMVKLRKASNNLKPCLKCGPIMDIVKLNQKTIIYSEFISSGIDIVKKLLEQQNIAYLQITGSVAKKKRADIVNQINDPSGPNVLFITKAGGEGLDLKGFRHVILMEKGWTVETEEQVIGRAKRYKSHAHLPLDQRNVTVHHLIVVKPEEMIFYDKLTRMIRFPTIEEREHMVSDSITKLNRIEKYLSADLYMFGKSRAKKIKTDELMALLQKYSVGRYQCDY